MAYSGHIWTPAGDNDVMTAPRRGLEKFRCYLCGAVCRLSEGQPAAEHCTGFTQRQRERAAWELLPEIERLLLPWCADPNCTNPVCAVPRRIRALLEG